MLNQFRATNIVWDKASLKLYAAIRVSSSDENGRKLVVQVINKGVTENLENTSLSLYWETQDGENRGLDPFEPLDAENGIYELYFRTGMLKHVGKLNAHLHLVDTTGAITSEPFTIYVFKGVDVDAMASEDELSALNKALIEVQNVKQNEAERVSAETERATAEEERKTAETARATAENTRASNEADRVNAEETRKTNETNRVDAESGRVTAETARVTAEEEREQGYPALDGRITAVEQNIDEHLADYAKGTMNRIILYNSANGADGVTTYVLGEEFVSSIGSSQYGLSISLKNVPANAKVSGYFNRMSSTRFIGPTFETQDFYIYQRACSPTRYEIGFKPIGSESHMHWSEITSGALYFTISW